MMPIMNGFDFLEAIQDDPKLRSVPILIVSAAERDTVEETARTSGAVGIIFKPFQLQPFLDAVQKFC